MGVVYYSSEVSSGQNVLKIAKFTQHWVLIKVKNEMEISHSEEVINNR